MDYLHKMILYQTVTPLHVGCGQAVGVVDLPIIRERPTGYPFIPGSGIRGVLRDIFEAKDRDLTKTLFGPESQNTDEERYAGCVAIHDARLLFYPVRADKKIFLWVTCPLVMERFKRDIQAFDITTISPLNHSGSLELNAGQFVGPHDIEGSVHLEEFSFTRAADKDTMVSSLDTFAQQLISVIPELATRILLISDSAFYHFVNYATILMQHNTLTTAKTVKEGALFSAESVPPESVFYGMISATHERRDFENGKDKAAIVEEMKTGLFDSGVTTYIHLGGKESTGMGLTQLTWKG